MDFGIWQESLQSAGLSVWTKLAQYIPNLFSGILLLVIGYMVSKFLRKSSEKLLIKLKIDYIGDKVGIHEGLKNLGIKKHISELISVIIFWLFMLTFVISAAESLELNNVTKTIDSFILYLPNVLGAALIFVLGLMFAHFVSGLIKGAWDKVNVEYSGLLANTTKIILIIVVSILSINQLQIETEFLDKIFQIILLSAGLVLVLSVGLGTRDIVKNIISGVYARAQFTLGTSVQVNDISGKLLEIGTVSAVIQTDLNKKIHLPNNVLVDSVVVVVSK